MDERASAKERRCRKSVNDWRWADSEDRRRVASVAAICGQDISE